MDRKSVMISGTIAGIATIGYFLLFYYIRRELILQPLVWWSSLLIYVVAMIRAAPVPGMAGFRQNLQGAFAVFVIANALFYLFYYLLFGVYDPGLVDLQLQQLAQRQGLPPAQEGLDVSVTAGKIFLSYCTSLIGGFALALLVAGLRSRLTK